MENIIAKAIEAHGGLDRWKKFKTVHASVSSGGHFFDLVHVPQDPTPRNAMGWLHKERLCFRPFGAPDRHADFIPNQVVVKTDGGETVLERRGTPDELHHHIKEDNWGPLNGATFTGYALWTYLTTPFFIAMPGFQIEEIEPWQEKNEKWYGVKVEFPSEILSHSRVQYFYFGNDFLLRRHDYYLDVAGEFWATQYVHDFVDADGIKLPTKRRAYKRGDDGHPLTDQLMIWIDLSEIKFM